MSCEYVLAKNGQPKKHSDANVAAELIWRTAQTTSAPSILVYVHGRDIKPFGNDGEPKSSYKEGIIAELENANPAVIMLHWPHSITPPAYTHMPIMDARAAGPALVNLLEALGSAKPAGATAKVVVVTHSMGSIVLESAALAAPEGVWSIVSRVIVAAGASSVEGSGNWLAKIACQRYVTTNKNDGTLEKAANGGPFLGRQSFSSFPAAEVAADVFYLDVQNCKVSHRYFVSAGSKSNPDDLEALAEHFFRPLFQSRAIDRTKFERVGQLYQLIKQ